MMVFWLLACSGTDTDTTPTGSTTLDVLQAYGSLEVCLSSSSGQSPTLSDTSVETDTWTVTGTLVSKLNRTWGEFLLVECNEDVDRVLEVVDSSGDTWYAGWTLRDADGRPIGLDPALEIDREVTFNFVRIEEGPGALSVRDESGLLLLMDSETVTDLMDASAYPGLGISWGMGYGASVSGDCNQQASQLALEGDGSSSLYSGDTDGLSIGDRAFHARAFSVYRDPDDPTCPKRRAFAVYQ